MPNYDKEIKFDGATVTITQRETESGTRTVEVSRFDDDTKSKSSIFENENNDRDACRHDTSPNGSESKTWFDKDDKSIKKEEDY